MMCPEIVILAYIVFAIIVALICPLLSLIEGNNKNKKLKEEIKELKKQIREAEAEAEVLVAEEVDRMRPKALTESKVKYIKGLILQGEKEIDKLDR